MTEPLKEVDLFPNSTEYPQFSDLQLARESDGQITFSREAMERFCRAFGRSLDTLSEDDMGVLITVHYLWHRAFAGGDPHPLVESLLPQASTESSIDRCRTVLIREFARTRLPAAAESPACSARRALVTSARP